jgi:hypothetical protein
VWSLGAPCIVSQPAVRCIMCGTRTPWCLKFLGALLHLAESHCTAVGGLCISARKSCVGVTIKGTMLLCLVLQVTNWYSLESFGDLFKVSWSDDNSCS